MSNKKTDGKTRFCFYRAAAMHPRSCHERLSIRPSVKRVNCDKTKEISVYILIPYEMPMHLVFRHEERLVGDVPFYLKIWAKLTHPLKTATSNRFSLVEPQP